jgi:2-hydroxychromene-2-carboxylate isomerase
MNTKPTVFFDFISPFAFLHWQLLKKRGILADFNFRPITLSSLFNHNGQKFIVEIPHKREYLYKSALRIAARNEITLLAPKTHPFNSLYCLRMVTQSTPTNQIDLIDCLWRVSWQERIDPGNPDELESELAKNGFQGPELIDFASNPLARKELKANTKEAIDLNIFGVPTISYQGEFFWGTDAIDDFLDFKAGKDPLDYKLYQTLKKSLLIM